METIPQQEVQKLKTEHKDPMRDSLMSTSDSGSECSDEETERITKKKDKTKEIAPEVTAPPNICQGTSTSNSIKDLPDLWPVQRVTSLNTSSETSGPNSLDLEFDLWEGQFEFVADGIDVDRLDSVFNGSGTAGGGAARTYIPHFKDIIKTVQMLQQQVGVLADTQINSDDRFSRVKQDNAGLQARLIMLEEQLREAETRGETRLSEEIKRNKELMQRIEREKELQQENFSIRYSSLEKDKSSIEKELSRLKEDHSRTVKELHAIEDRISELEFSNSILQDENKKVTEASKREQEEWRSERERGSQIIEELRSELERLRTVEESFRKRSPSVDSAFGTAEFEREIKELREENKELQEQVEELQAQLLTSGLEEGRNLMSQTNNDSLAAEFERMNSDEGPHFEDTEQLRQSLKDSQEANHDLRAYIDGILLNIVENYPQLLEVKNTRKNS